MTAHIPTLLLVIVVAGSVLAMSVAAVANRHQRDGMTFWAAGLAMHTVSYVFFSMVPATGEFAAFLLAILFRSCAWAAFAEGLCEFYRRPPPRALIWAPVVAATLAFVVLYEHLTLRVVTTSVLFAAQSILALSLMWHARRTTSGRGQYFLMTGLVMATALLAMRAMGAASGRPAELVAMTGGSPIQVVGLMGALIALILLSIGFLLMSKDRADALNRLLAKQDELTGLANRRSLNEALASEWARSRRSEQPFALVMIDIDYFKHYNDRYGHQAGDACLKRVAQVLETGMRRAGDLAARYGGEEFLLILPNTDAADARHLAEGVRETLERLNLPHLDSPTGKVTISAGVAATTDGVYRDAGSLLRAADQALYRAKNAGRNQVQVALEPIPQGARPHKSRANLVQLNWRRAYESGHPVIDAQHFALFKHVNRLLDALLAGQPATHLSGLVDDLVAHIRQHFADEEAILEQVGFPAGANHADLHHALLDQAETLAGRFKNGSITNGDLFEYLAHEVVARHILIADREFFSYLASKN